MPHDVTTPAPPIPPRVRDVTGRTFGRLTVLAFAGHLVRKTQRDAAWLCRCSCGAEKVIQATPLNRGATKSCGCLGREARRRATRTHGMSRSPEHAAWHLIKQICLNPRARRYRAQGGRGICICQRWRDSFEAFLADVGRRPSPKHTISRIDHDGDYEPGNVVWSTTKVQGRFRHNSRLLTFQGETLCLKDWARRLGFCYATLQQRLDRGWSVEATLTTPPRVVARRGITSPSGRRGRPAPA